MYLAYVRAFFLTFCMVYLWKFFVVEVRRSFDPKVAVRQGTLGPGDHFHPEVAVRVPRGYCDQELAVEVRRRRDAEEDVKFNNLYLTSGQEAEKQKSRNLGEADKQTSKEAGKKAHKQRSRETETQE